MLMITKAAMRNRDAQLRQSQMMPSQMAAMRGMRPNAVPPSLQKAVFQNNTNGM